MAGVILFPRRNTLYTARIGQGAFKDKEQIHTSNRALRDGIISFSYGYLRNPEDLNYNKQEQEEKIDLLIGGFFRAFGGRVQTVQIGVCVTWVLCQMAANEGPVAFLHNYVTPYDVGAAEIIVKEAGGVVSPVGYSKDRQGVLVAANQEVYNEVVDKLGQDLRRRANLPF